MFIRNDFVTNSSSTSFVIIAEKEINADYLVDKLGIKKGNVLYDGFHKTCERMISSQADGFAHFSIDESRDKEVLTELFGEKTANKVMKALDEGKTVYFGNVATDNDDELESCIAQDCFTIDEQDFFMDATSFLI